MNVVANFGSTLTLDPDYIDLGSAYSIAVTIVPPSGAGWTVTGVSSDPAKTWVSNTAVLDEGGYYITVETSVQGQSGTAALRVSRGVRDD